jgi:RNA-directed DNA polymerase
VTNKSSTRPRRPRPNRRAGPSTVSDTRSRRDADILTERGAQQFQPAMSPEALKSKSQEMRRWRIHRRTSMDLQEIAEWLNPIVRGWMNYYGEFNRSEMYSLLERINTYLMRWARKKYKRLRTWKRFKAWWRGLTEREPELFAHWAWMRAYHWTG